MLLSSCGGSDEQAEPREPESSKTPATTLAETCPEIEAGLPGGFYPKPTRWIEYGDQLEALSEQGDTETQNAIGIITPAVGSLAADPGGSDLLDARAELRDGLDVLADRCEAVGSSALQ